MNKWFRNTVLLIMLLLAGRAAAQTPVLDSVCGGAVRHYGVFGETGSTYSWFLTPSAGAPVLLPSDADTVEIVWAYPPDVYLLHCIQHAVNGCNADAVFGLIYLFDAPEVTAGPDHMVCLDRPYKLIDATETGTATLLWTTSGDGAFDDVTWLNPTYMPGPGDAAAGVVTLTLTGFGVVQDEEACPPSVSSMQLYIVSEIIPQFDSIGPLCQYVIAPALPDTSLEGITGTWEPPVISTDVAGIFTYTFTPDDTTQCGVVTTMDIAVETEIVPQFEPVGPLCQYSTPPVLPGVSLEGIAGTWEPPVISTGDPGTFYFTFTPYPDQCGTDTTIEIIVLPLVTPEFDPIGPLCQYAAAPILPETSLNGITGSWNPAWINTSTPGSFTFTFTPDPGQCAVVTGIVVLVIPEIMPEFEPIGPLCQYSPPPVLPDTCLQGVAGTWEPPVVSTDVTGTFFYTFTPLPVIPCVLPVTIAITVVSDIVPEFDPIGPLCQNIVPPALPDTSLNGITGAWVPPVIDTSVPGAFIYVFTPDEGQCAGEFEMEIVITDEITPVFDPIGPLCQNSTPPALPGTSLNGITGTWVPPVISTGETGAFSFVFTPDPGQCGVEATLEVTIVTGITPLFDPIGPLCQNIVPPALPDTSLNGITGTWNPPVINTSTVGTFTFTFTPDNPEQCGTVTELYITIVTEIMPEFETVGPLCQGSAAAPLPGTSLNGITGTWDPPVPDTGVPGTFLYTFTPDAGQCAVVTTMPIEVTDEIVPVFDQIGPLCQYATAPVLPGVSVNGITGSWTPAVIGTFIPGTETYTFTPDAGQCAVVTTMDIEVREEVTPLFDPIGPLSQGSTPPVLPVASNNIPPVTGTWDPPAIDTSVPGTYTYTFTPDEGQCALVTDMEITVLFDYLYAISGAGGHCLTGAAIVPLEVDHFTSVAIFQLKLSYNVDKLLCEGYINPNPLLEANITGVVDQLAGVITINWQSDVPVSFAGQTTVCELLFTPKEPGQGQLTWYTGPTESYFNDIDGLPIPAVFFTEELEIYEPPSILLAESKSACVGDTVIIYSSATGTYPPLKYTWTYPDGHTTDVDPFFEGVTQDEAGDYILLVTDSLGCTDQKAIRLVVSENPVAEFHGTDTLTVSPGYILEAGYDLAYYLWNTGETTESIEIDSTGWYWVSMESHMGCTGTDSVFVVVSESIKKDCFFIPNAFTPNNDGLNDTFKVVSFCTDVTSFRMMIFNRWGEELYETSDMEKGWDGTKNGSPVPGDVYVYKITYKINGIPGMKEDNVKVGNVMVLK
jgi:gliding motility-associated-like protein